MAREGVNWLVSFNVLQDETWNKHLERRALQIRPNNSIQISIEKHTGATSCRSPGDTSDSPTSKRTRLLVWDEQRCSRDGEELPGVSNVPRRSVERTDYPALSAKWAMGKTCFGHILNSKSALSDSSRLLQQLFRNRKTRQSHYRRTHPKNEENIQDSWHPRNSHHRSRTLVHV